MAEVNNLNSDKKRVLEALEEAHGIVSIACKNAGIGRTSFYNWKNDDSEFAAAVEEVNESAIDHVEGKLFNRIDDKDTTAIIFFLKTRAKKRGYVERQEHTGPDGESLFINFRTVGNNANGPVYETKSNGTTMTKSGPV